MSAPGPTDNGRVVVIDDDHLVRDSLCVFLEDAGFDVLSAASGREGLQLVHDAHPDVVLCDLRMPDMDGLKVLEAITRELPETPVIVVSGAGIMTDVVEALRLGAADYLVKPIIDMSVLDHAVRAVLHKVALETENEQYRKELEAANAELEENLEILRQDQEAGRQAQLQLLPEPRSRFGAFRFEHAILPSLYLSGDFLDYFEIDASRIGFYIADVSGHGAASAFVTMMLKSLINQPLRRYRIQGDETILHPDKLLAQLNHEVLDAHLGKYLTLFYGVLDRDSGLLRFANGGQYPRPWCVHSDGHSEFLGEGSFPIGLFDWAEYRVEERVLGPGSLLVMASDGMLEALHQDGLAKNESLLSSACATHPDVDTLMTLVRKRVGNAPPDDITVFQIRHQG